MQSAPMYIAGAAAPAAAGSPAVVRPSLRRADESELSARLRLLAQPMKIDLPSSTPQQPRARRAPPGLEQPTRPQSDLAPPATPPGAFAGPHRAHRKGAHDHEGSDQCSTSAEHDEELSEASAEAEDCTTMAILNIPYTYPKWKLERQMDSEGYTFNYFHFPKDSRRGRNRGFAFVNFTTAEMAQAFRRKFDNVTLFHPGEKEKRITVLPSSLQGFERNRALHPGAAARALRTTMQRG